MPHTAVPLPLPMLRSLQPAHARACTTAARVAVVALQVFSKMAESRSLADRWRAHGIALLATRYPSVRVAYLEADGEPLTLFKAADFAYRVVHQVRGGGTGDAWVCGVSCCTSTCCR